MASYLIPLQNLPDQTFFIELGGKDCEIHIYLRHRYMYMDLKVEDKQIFQGIICLNGVNLNQYEHLGFKGELKFIDTQGEEDPYYTGFEDRWELVYAQ